MIGFQGKKVLITGAGHGIGLAIAESFARESARVAINDLNKGSVQQGLQSLSTAGIGIPGNVADESEARAVVKKAAEELGGLDIVVSNAGVYPSRPFLEMTIEEWDHVIGVNARGTFLICQEAARIMKQNLAGGSIVTISSGSARFARVGSAHYCASKAAVVMLTQVMALELAPYKIRVNSVAPGIIDVPGGPVLAGDYKEAMTRMVPWGRMGKPEDVARVVLLISDPEAEYVTGQVIPVDGGLSSGRFGIPTS